jgi:hypothetical protein
MTGCGDNPSNPHKNNYAAGREAFENALKQGNTACDCLLAKVAGKLKSELPKVTIEYLTL